MPKCSGNFRRTFSGRSETTWRRCIDCRKQVGPDVVLNDGRKVAQHGDYVQNDSVFGVVAVHHRDHLIATPEFDVLFLFA